MLPPTTLEWLIGAEPAAVLLLGASAGNVAMLKSAGHTVTVIDEDPTALALLAIRYPDIYPVAAKAAALPFDPCYFGAIIAIQNFHTVAPTTGLREWARVLRPGGRLGVAYLTRDDSVPWVRKLKRIVQATLPEAMTSDYGLDSITDLRDSLFFSRHEELSNRLWVPCTRSQLQDSARGAEGAAELEETELAAMVDEVGELYDEYARAPDPLQLPYKIACWRAHVDQTSLTTKLAMADDGLSISF
jgi:SAM-dependent methyltransferase